MTPWMQEHDHPPESSPPPGSQRLACLRCIPPVENEWRFTRRIHEFIANKHDTNHLRNLFVFRLDHQPEQWRTSVTACKWNMSACTGDAPKLLQNMSQYNMKQHETVVPFRASSSSSTSSNWALSMLLTLQGFIIPMSLEKCLGWWLLCVFQPAFTSGAETASRRSIISSGWQALQRSLRLLLRSWRAKTANTKKKWWDKTTNQSRKDQFYANGWRLKD